MDVIGIYQDHFFVGKRKLANKGFSGKKEQRAKKPNYMYVGEINNHFLKFNFGSAMYRSEKNQNPQLVLRFVEEAHRRISIHSSN